MLKSMTGFASVTSENDLATIGVTVRSVNHRYLDLQIRIPPSLAELEARVRALVQQRVARGRVEIAVSVQTRRLPPVDVQLNELLLDALESALDRARARGVVSGPLTPGDLLRVPQALTMKERPESVQIRWPSSPIFPTPAATRSTSAPARSRMRPTGPTV